MRHSWVPGSFRISLVAIPDPSLLSRVWVLTTIRPRAHRNSVCLHCARRPARAGVRPATRAHEGRTSSACITVTGRIPSISGGSSIGPSAPCLVSCLELQPQLLERAIIAAGPHWATLQAYASLGLLGLLFPGEHKFWIFKLCFSTFDQRLISRLCDSAESSVARSVRAPNANSGPLIDCNATHR